MKNKFKVIAIGIMMVMVLQLGMYVKVTANENTASKDIVETASQDQRFETLVKALKAAGLTETLKGAGPYTVFAPTNDAFKKLPAGTLDDLLKPENQAKLADILTYHVKDGKVSAEEALKLNGQEIKMLNGKPAKIEVRGNDLFIDGAKVIVKDIQTKNGIIHAIDAVMIP